MALSSDLSVLTQTIVDILRADADLKDFHDIFYGDQAAIPRVPAITVEAGPKDRAYTQTGLQTTVEITMHIVIYHAKTTDKQVVQKEIDQHAQTVEDVLHKSDNVRLITTGNPTGHVINGLVTNNEPGFIARGSATFIASRLTWTALVKERIGV